MNNIIMFKRCDGIVTVDFNTIELQLFKMPELVDNFWDYIESQNDFLTLVFNLKGVVYIDSSALGFFVRVHIKLSKQKVRVVLKNVHEDVIKILENARLVKDFNIE